MVLRMYRTFLVTCYAAYNFVSLDCHLHFVDCVSAGSYPQRVLASCCIFASLCVCVFVCLCVCVFVCLCVCVFGADVFHFDEQFDDHQKEYEAIRREILGEEDDDEEEDDDDEDEEDEEDEAEAEAEQGSSSISLLYILVLSVYVRFR